MYPIFLATKYHLVFMFCIVHSQSQSINAANLSFFYLHSTGDIFLHTIGFFFKLKFGSELSAGHCTHQKAHVSILDFFFI